jgi:hypothetical protein
LVAVEGVEAVENGDVGLEMVEPAVKICPKPVDLRGRSVAGPAGF